MREHITLDTTDAARQEAARGLAAANGWSEVFHKTENCLIRFNRGSETLDYWYSRNTVGTIVNHPKKGRNQLFRRRVDYPTLKLLFINPRQHTGVGYYTK